MNVPEPVETLTLSQACTVRVYPSGTTPEQLLAALGSLPDGTAEAWHPFWGNASRVQRLVELASGATISGRPFIVAKA